MSQPSYTHFGYPLHSDERQHNVPLDGVPTIPHAVARRWSRDGEDALMSELERRQCDDAIEAAKHVLFERSLRRGGCGL